MQGGIGEEMPGRVSGDSRWRDFLSPSPPDEHGLLGFSLPALGSGDRGRAGRGGPPESPLGLHTCQQQHWVSVVIYTAYLRSRTGEWERQKDVRKNKPEFMMRLNYLPPLAAMLEGRILEYRPLGGRKRWIRFKCISLITGTTPAHSTCL